MKSSQNYIKYYDDKIKVSVSPLTIPYNGGEIDVIYYFNEIKEFSNGYKTKSYLNRIKHIEIPQRMDTDSKYMSKPLSGEFYDAEIDKIIKWNGVVQEGLVLPQLEIRVKDSYIGQEIPLDVVAQNKIVPSNPIWKDTLIKKSSRNAYDTTIDDSTLIFNKNFSGITMLTVSAEDYISCSKLVSVNYEKNGKLVYNVENIKQSTYEVNYDEKSFDLSFVGTASIIIDDEIYTSFTENVLTTIYLSSNNMSDSMQEINSEYIWNGVNVPYTIKQHGAKECNGEIKYEIISISPTTQDDYISWNESIVEVKYVTNKKEMCYDGSTRETINSEKIDVQVGFNDSGLDIIRSGEITWETAKALWQCLQEANPNLVIIGSTSEILSIEDDFEIPFSADTITLTYNGVNHKHYLNNRIEDEYITTSTTINVLENTSASVKELNGSIMWNKTIKNWKLVQLPNPKKVISTRYDIEILYPQSSDKISWSADTLNVIYNTVTENTCVDGSLDVIKTKEIDVKNIEPNKELVDVLLNGSIAWNNAIANWSCIQLPNQSLIFDKVEYLISNVNDGFTIPSTATTATITYDVISRIYFLDGHYKDDIVNKSKLLNFQENLTNERKEISGVFQWNDVAYQWVIYQRGKRKQNN